jgi:hypothetical protein
MIECRKHDLVLMAGLMSVVVILIGGSSATSVYGEKIVFETPFESSTVPACSNEEVAISGVAKFTFTEEIDKDGNIQTKATMTYHAHGEGITSGTKYIIYEKAVDMIDVEVSGGDTTFNTVLKGTFIGQGSEPNTQVRIQLVTVLHENGDVETIVDDVDVNCNGQ